jgi:hypothetical protein
MPSIAAIACTSRVVEARKASRAPSTSSISNSPSSTSSSSTSRARVIDSRIPVERAGVRSGPSADTQKIEEVGASSTKPSGRTRSASSAPRACAIRVACMFAA